MVKKALLVGCNYPGTEAQLRGCVNDVWSIFQLLTSKKGFDRNNIKVMIDTDNRYEKPTGRNMRRALTEFITSSQPGDVLVFHFSGHGTQIPAEGPDPEADGKDEAICPTDLNIIVDDDLRKIVEQLPSGVDLTFICDCCHSGGLLDHESIIISDAGKPMTMPGGGSLMDLMAAVAGRDFVAKPREIPLALLAQMLSQQSGMNVQPGNIRSSMSSIFGSDASAACLKFAAALAAAQMGSGARTGADGGAMALISCCLQVMAAQSAGGQQQQQQQPQQGYGGSNQGYGGSSQGYGGSNNQGYGGSSQGYNQPSGYGSNNTQPPPVASQPAPIAPAAPTSYPSNFVAPPAGQKPDQLLSAEKGVLVTGCESNQTSADACPSGDPSKAFGALTNAIVTLCERNPNMTYYELVSSVRTYLKGGGFSQKPCLECAPTNAQKPFIC